MIAKLPDRMDFGPRPPKVRPLKKTAIRPGRNEPCPCGSGKKAKKCCIRQHQLNEQAQVTRVMDKLREMVAERSQYTPDELFKGQP
jgi:hypothetical protein